MIACMRECWVLFVVHGEWYIQTQFQLSSVADLEIWKGGFTAEGSEQRRKAPICVPCSREKFSRSFFSCLDGLL